jgi:ribosomal protein S12 methylthiotransferase accessory factor YcaO
MVMDNDDLNVNAGSSDDDDDLPALEDLEIDDDEIDDDDDEGGNDKGNNEEEDELEILNDEEREALLENTAVVRTTLDKVSQDHLFLVRLLSDLKLLDP